MEPATKIKDQCGYLQNLKSNISSFGPDQINMIHGYFPETGIKTHIIEAFEKTAKELRSHSNKELYRKDNEMRRRFMNFIDSRIALLQEPQKGHDLDPWMELSFFPENKEMKEKLQEISYHIQDVLFSCELAAEFELNDCVNVSLEDLESLKAKLAKEYASFLRKNADTASIQKLLDALPAEMNHLETSMKSHLFNEVRKLLQQIKQELKVSAVALKSKSFG